MNTGMRGVFYRRFLAVSLVLTLMCVTAASAEVGVVVDVPATAPSAKAANFGYVRIANNGTVAASTTLGSGPTDWACTRHTVTGLVWEVKLAAAGVLRSASNTYSWHSTDGASNGGNDGTANGGACTASTCDTQAYVAAVNATALCGFTDWRLPSKRELSYIMQEQSLEGTGNATINATYLPNTLPTHYWTSTNFAPNPSLAWMGNFNRGGAVYQAKSTASHAMLVRGTP